MIKIKLSKTQQAIVDLLIKHPKAFIIKSPYYNHNDVILPKEESIFPDIVQFKRPTFEFLERNNIIQSLDGKKYFLNNN